MAGESNTPIAAFTVDQAARLSGVSRRQLRAWAKDGFFSPAIVYEEGHTPIRLYSFRDLLSLRVLNQLRNETRVSLGHLRDVKRDLSHLGEDAWIKSTLYLLGRRVVIERDDETRHEAGTGQEVFQIPLKVVVGGMRERIRDLNTRDDREIGRIERRRGVAGGRAVVAGTRIPVATIREFLEAGYTTAQIMDEYPALRAADIEAAILFESERSAA